MTITGIGSRVKTSGRARDNRARPVSSWETTMSETNSMGVNPDETVEPSGKTIHNARWQFEWSNLKNNRRFPL